MGLFDRVFRGSDEMYFKAETELNAVIAELGEDAPMTMPDTAYFLACIYAYLGKKVTQAERAEGSARRASQYDGSRIPHEVDLRFRRRHRVLRGGHRSVQVRPHPHAL